MLGVFLVSGARPFFGFLQGFAGLAFTAGEDEPMGFWVLYAVEHGFGGTGEVLAGLASPETDFESTGVAKPVLLVTQEFV